MFSQTPYFLRSQYIDLLALIKSLLTLMGQSGEGRRVLSRSSHPVQLVLFCRFICQLEKQVSP